MMKKYFFINNVSILVLVFLFIQQGLISYLKVHFYLCNKIFLTQSCIVCNFSYSHFGKKVSIIQENSKNTQIQVKFLPFL